MIEYLLSGEVLMSLLMLTFMEIVLGIDNIVFISIVSNKLKKEEQPKARNIGLILAMVFRIILLFGITWVLKLSEPFIQINWGWFNAGFSGQSLIIFAGGLFLLYKSVSEIHHKLEGEDEHGNAKAATTIGKAIAQIAALNIVFSFDSILTAIGMVDLVPNWEGWLNPGILVMIIAVVISIIIMIVFAGPVARFVNEHPSVQILGLSFLLLIGFMLISEGAHLSHLQVFGTEVGVIPKGYLYFAIFFSLLVEFLNLRMKAGKSDPVQLRNPKLEDSKIADGEPGI